MIRIRAARLRRHRAARRRLRDLQHPVDHGRPAHSGVRDAADARRLAQAGHALGASRGPRDRPARLGDRARHGPRDRQGHGRAVQRPRRRAARRRHGHRDAHDHDVAHRRHRCHASRQHPAGAARDPRPADRGGPRGRGAAAVEVRGAFGQDRSRSCCRRRSRRSSRRCSPTGSAPDSWRCCSGGRARPVRGHRAAGAAPREADRPHRGLAGAPRRWRRRRAGRRQRRPQPGPDRVDRGRAHDRAHARDGRGGARLRHQRRDAVGDQEAGPRRLRDRRRRRPAVPGLRGRQARGDRRRHGGVARPLRRRDRERASSARSAGSTPRRSRTSTRSTGPRAPSARSTSSAPTARSSRRPTPRTST